MTVRVRTRVPVHLPLCVFDFSACCVCASLLFVVSVYVFLLYEVCVYVVCACVHACVGMCVCSHMHMFSPLSLLQGLARACNNNNNGNL